MKGSMFLIAVTVYLQVCGAIAAEPCNEYGETYTDCGSSCPETCENRGKQNICTDQCVTGCFCKKGLVRSSDGKCVRPDQCSNEKSCNEDGEIYTDCGSSCPETCENRGKQNICTAQCVPGCFCKKGLVRSSDGKCVQPDQCSNKNLCEEVEEYTDCGSSCPDTCDNFGDDRMCTMECVRGCFCKKGLVRNINGKCIPLSECENKYCPRRYTYVCIRSINQCCSDVDCGEGRFCCSENCGNTCHAFTDVKTDGQRVTPNSNCVIDETYAKA